MTRGAVLFDLDGTLLDSLAGIHAALLNTAEELQLAPPAEARTRASIGDGVENLLLRAFDAPADLPRLHAVYDRHYSSTSIAAARAFTGIEPLLRALDPARTAVLSNKPERHCRRLLRALDLEQCFAHIAGGDTFPEKKPSALPVLRLLAQLGADAADAVLVGDGPQDIRAARNAGVKSIAVLWGFSERSKLAGLGPDLVVEDVAALMHALATHARRHSPDGLSSR